MRTALHLTVAILIILGFLLMLNAVLAGREQHRPTVCNGPFVCAVALDATQVRALH